MRILIPMAGEGKRFSDAGYKVSKPAIKTIDRRTGEEFPMVVCATRDLPGVLDKGSNVIYVDRVFHKNNGTEKTILACFPQAKFITVSELTEGQACTCLLAKDEISDQEELLIAGCDNGMIYNLKQFENLKKISDVIVFTYRHNESVLENPNAYGWILADNEGKVTGLSIKKAVSEMPTEDHAIVATFWFREGKAFVEDAQKMISENDRINNEFYVDEVLKYSLRAGRCVRIFEIERYIGWGTPKDYEDYQNTYYYWKKFIEDPRCLAKKK